jgi:ubiquinone/menaquinone biosynthesis C-methylase UbiE
MAAGVDPAAVAGGGSGPLYRAGAQSLPFDDGAFDGALFINALHHVPGDLMERALREAARVTGPGRCVLVVEPLAVGSFFEALRVIEDETDIRAAAQAAVEQALGYGVFELSAKVEYVRRDVLAGIAPFLAKVLAADGAREAVISRESDAIAAAFERAALRDERGYRLEQPIRAHILSVR